jgi:hypothetical protein
MLFLLAVGSVCAIGCGQAANGADGSEAVQQGIQTDPATGIPYATTYQFPLQGLNASDLGFGFASMNTLICMSRDSQGGCLAYGYHLARDTQVGKTPYGTLVVAPADGIVRVTTDITLKGYGATNSANPDYYGCVIVLEHMRPNGQAFTSLLGHVKCENAQAYDPSARTGNPKRDTVVRRGQYLGRIGHYWYGAGKTVDWHHLHFGIRQGRYLAASYTRSGVYKWVRGYAARSEFTTDAQTGKLVHPEWTDPAVILKELGDPALTPDVGVRHHPPGSILEDAQGGYWLVAGEAELARIPASVMQQDRYDPSRAVRASADELACYARAADVVSLGQVTLYQRPGSPTVVMAYDAKQERYDVIRQEALFSWGYGFGDIMKDAAKIQKAESQYAPKGFRRLRPGSLVKAVESSEVCIVTPWQTRRPIVSGEVFEKLGYAWERVVAIPQDVLDAVAGPRESGMVTWDSIFDCALPAPCPSDGDCGGGAPPEDYFGEDDGGGPAPDAGVQATETCNGLDDDGNGAIDEIFMCRQGAADGPGCTAECGTSGQRVCDAPDCSWGTCRPFAEGCANTIDDDCNGLVDCADPACASDPACQAKPDAGTADSAQSAPNGMTLLRFVYSGPATPGAIKLNAWWQPPNASARAWSQVTDCIDAQSGDGRLDCQFPVASQSSPFEFQIDLPNGQYWGDQSCWNGGCGTTVGDLAVYGPDGVLGYALVPNQSGPPYYNGRIEIVP